MANLDAIKNIFPVNKSTFLTDGLSDKRRREGLFEPMVRQRVRIRFSKSRSLKYIGHKDLLRTFESLFRRARLPLAMSGGFHPKVRMSFPSALALGVEGFDEVLELEMDESVASVDTNVLLADLNRCSVDGLKFLTARVLEDGTKKARLVSSVFQMVLPENFREGIPGRVSQILSNESLFVEKTNGKTPGRSVDLRSALSELVYLPETGELRAELLTSDGPEAGIRELLSVLELDQELFKSIFPRRIRCRLVDEPGNDGLMPN